MAAPDLMHLPNLTPGSVITETADSNVALINELQAEITQLKAQLLKTNNNDSKDSDPTLLRAHILEQQNEIKRLNDTLESQKAQYQRQVADLISQVDSLNNKLIESVEKMADLEDTLAVAQHEADFARVQIAELEKAMQQHDYLMKAGVLVESDKVHMEMNALKTKLLEESKQRGKAEKDKQTIESELEELSKSLFEEANKMVVTERLEKAKSEKQREQLHAKLADTESLLASQQEQLVELKNILEMITAENKELMEMKIVNNMDRSTPPSPTPTGNRVNKDSVKRGMDGFLYYPSGVGSEHSSVKDAPLSPSGPSFSYYVPCDILQYMDFVSFLESCYLLLTPEQPIVASPSTRSNNYFSPFASPLSSQVNLGTFLSNNISSSSLPTNIPSNNSMLLPNGGNSKNKESVMASIRDHRFIKRCLTEDVEPTLRLDSAPGLSWLPRRQVLTSIIEGTLVIEPITQYPPFTHIIACTLCGQSAMNGAKQHGETYIFHRFRITEKGNSHPYPMCGYCTNRVRATCDLFVYLRHLRAGHIPLAAATTSSNTHTPIISSMRPMPFNPSPVERERQRLYAECARLRENMFWTRLGVNPNLEPFSMTTWQEFSMTINNVDDMDMTRDTVGPMSLMQGIGVLANSAKRGLEHIRNTSLGTSSSTTDVYPIKLDNVPSRKNKQNREDDSNSINNYDNKISDNVGLFKDNDNNKMPEKMDSEYIEREKENEYKEIIVNMMVEEIGSIRIEHDENEKKEN